MNPIFKKCKFAVLFNDDAADAPDANFLRHAGCNIDNSILILQKGKKLLITSEMNYSKAKKLCKFHVKAVERKDIPVFLKKLVGKMKIGVDFEGVSAGRYKRMKKVFGKKIVDIHPELVQMRAIKTKNEIKNISKAVKITKKILSNLKLKPNMREIDVVRALRFVCIKNNVLFSFPPIVAAGKNSSKPHHTPEKKKLGKGIVLVDFGIKYKNYCSDLTRCYFLGKCKKEREKYEEAKKIFYEIIKNIEKCKNFGELTKNAGKIVKRNGWKKMVHSIGHGIGIDVHDFPLFYKKSKQKLQDNMAFAIEPAWYGKKFGVRFEQNLILKKGKPRIL
ncbi:MAG: Xaa-Pro peptidase family protein [Candidatus Micrarchaeota archaeon]